MAENCCTTGSFSGACFRNPLTLSRHLEIPQLFMLRRLWANRTKEILHSMSLSCLDHRSARSCNDKSKISSFQLQKDLQILIIKHDQCLRLERFNGYPEVSKCALDPYLASSNKTSVLSARTSRTSYPHTLNMDARQILWDT